MWAPPEAALWPPSAPPIWPGIWVNHLGGNMGDLTVNVSRLGGQVVCQSFWQVPACTLPAHCQNLTVQRILVRHGVSRDRAELLLDDIRQALASFERHPDHAVLTPAETRGFHH